MNTQIIELSVASLLAFDFYQLIAEIEKSIDERRLIATKQKEKEKAVVVGLELPEAKWNSDETLVELAQLVNTAGAEVVGVFKQRRAYPNSAYYIGTGKIKDIILYLQSINANTLVFDDELSPVQQRNLEEVFQRKIIDRTNLILDIFAQRAKTKEAKLQVELALLKYKLPRLTGLGIELSRLGGGIGTRGPGETKLEIDRRRLRKRIEDLERGIDEIRSHRNLLREKRQEEFPTVALCGYTNAGKSTLMNLITSSNLLVEDKLFATLDPTVRRTTLHSGRTILYVDTVGFIQKLPHTLIAAFRATLEEVLHADLLLHVMDISHPMVFRQKYAVESILEELGVARKKIINVFNKK